MEMDQIDPELKKFCDYISAALTEHFDGFAVVGFKPDGTGFRLFQVNPTDTKTRIALAHLLASLAAALMNPEAAA